MKTNPLPYQLAHLPLLKNNIGLIWDMGTGKTWMGAYLLEAAHKHGVSIDQSRPSIVVCPNSLMEVWRNQLLEHSELTFDDIRIVTGSKIVRERILKEEASVYIINYEGCLTVQQGLLSVHWKTVIVDEAHRIKNPKSKQAKIITMLSADRRLLLTGTPILNSYLDIWNLAYFVDRGATFGKSFFVFRTTYFYDANQYIRNLQFPNWKIKPQMEQILKDKMKQVFHRLEKCDVLKDLPGKIYTKRYCYLTKEQEELYIGIKRDCIAFINENAVTTKVALTKALKLNQITSGFLKDDAGVINVLDDNPKMELLAEVVDEILTENDTNKVIIWAHFRHDIETIYEKFRAQAVRVYGGVSTEERNEAEYRFQKESDVRIFVGQPMSAGEGLTLTAANYGVYYSMNYSSKDRRQSEDRCHRKGSEIHDSIVYIDLIAQGTIDEIVLRKVDDKIDFADSVLSYLKAC